MMTRHDDTAAPGWRTLGTEAAPLSQQERFFLNKDKALELHKCLQGEGDLAP